MYVNRTDTIRYIYYVNKPVEYCAFGRQECNLEVSDCLYIYINSMFSYTYAILNV